MRLRLVGALVGIAALIVVVFSLPLVSFVSRVERDRLVTALERDAFIMAGHAKETLNTSAGVDLPSLDPYIVEYSQQHSAKVVVTNAQGLVVSTNDATELIGDDFSNRPEITAALDGNPAVGERESQTLGEELVYVAVPVFLGDQVLGSVRISERRSEVDATVRSRILGIATAGFFTLLAAMVIALPLALGIARPLERLRRRTDTLAEGNFAVRADDSTGPPEVRELARSFNAMASRLGSMLESQRQFAGDVSHQLRTPLTAMRLRLEQLQAGADAAGRDAVDAIGDEVERMNLIVEQLLVLARLESGVVKTERIDVGNVVTSRLEMWQPLAEEQNMTVIAEVEDGLACRATSGSLEQILDNYIDNALSIAPDGSQITVSARRVGDRVQVDVSDEGPGMSPEHRARAFERFWRGGDSQHRSGSGLGLAIVRQLAIVNGGSVELLERHPRGTTARVTLLAAP